MFYLFICRKIEKKLIADNMCQNSPFHAVLDRIYELISKHTKNTYFSHFVVIVVK